MKNVEHLFEAPVTTMMIGAINGALKTNWNPQNNLWVDCLYNYTPYGYNDINQ